MGLSDSMLFNNTELFCSVHIFICWYDSKGNHSLVSGKVSNEERKAVLHVRRKIPPRSKYSFAQPSVLQQNTSSIRRVLAGTRLSIKAYVCYSQSWSSQREFFISSGKGRSVSAQWNVNSTFFMNVHRHWKEIVWIQCFLWLCFIIQRPLEAQS